MKKIIIAGGMLSALVCFSANAQISIQANFGEPMAAYVEAPAYVAPAPIYPSYAVEPAYYHHWHRKPMHRDRDRDDHRR